jgi:hypothetical protein
MLMLPCVTVFNAGAAGVFPQNAAAREPLGLLATTASLNNP